MFSEEEILSSVDSSEMSVVGHNEFTPAVRDLRKTQELTNMRDELLRELELLELEFLEKLSEDADEDETDSKEMKLSEISELMQKKRDKLVGVSNFLVDSIQKAIQSLQNAKKTQSEMEIIGNQVDKLYEVLDTIEPEHLVKNDEVDRSSLLMQEFESSLRQNLIPRSPLGGLKTGQMITSTPQVRPRTLKRPEMFIINSLFSGDDDADSQGQNQPDRRIEIRQQQARERAVKMQNKEISNRITRHALHEKSSRIEEARESSIKISDVSIRKKVEFDTKDEVILEMIFFYNDFIDSFCKEFTKHHNRARISSEAVYLNFFIKFVDRFSFLVREFFILSSIKSDLKKLFFEYSIGNIEFETKKLAMGILQNFKLPFSPMACSDVNPSVTNIDFEIVQLQRDTIDYCIEHLKKIFDPIMEAMIAVDDIADETDDKSKFRSEFLKIVSKLRKASEAVPRSSDFFQSDRFINLPKTEAPKSRKSTTFSRLPVSKLNFNESQSSPKAKAAESPSRTKQQDSKLPKISKIPYAQQVTPETNTNRISPSSLIRKPSVNISKIKFIGTRPNAANPPQNNKKKLPHFSFAKNDAQYDKIYEDEIEKEFKQRGYRVTPFMWNRYTTEIPNDVLEMDILYVATILADYNINDLPVRYSHVVGEILKTARNFINGSITRETASFVIHMLLKKFECIPLEFYQTFIYSRSNKFFSHYRKETEFNEFIRASRFKRNYIECPRVEEEFSNSLRDLIEAPKINKFYDEAFGDDLEELCKQIVSGSWKENANPKYAKIWGDVTINGYEMSNDGESKLAFPGKIDEKMRHKIANIESQFGSIPPVNIAADTIIEDMALIQQNLQKDSAQKKELLSQSKIFRQGIKYLLNASALNRHTFFQARGSEMPSWFPGFYLVFPDSFKLQPTTFEPSQALFHAWRCLAPFNNK